MLWELLVLMAQHQGQLKVNYTPSSTSKAAGLLRGAVTAAAGAAVSAATAATAATGSETGSAAGTPKAGGGSASATPVAGAAAGGTAAGGTAAGGTDDGAADSELLKILTPELSSAVGPLSGLRILSHQVAEMELQATATEMQVRIITWGTHEKNAQVGWTACFWGMVAFEWHTVLLHCVLSW
jgi:hypothetical protein